MLPIGYKLIEGKPGFLAIDDDQANLVTNAFKLFLEKQTLSQTAKALNEGGARIHRQAQGGQGKDRLGHFTVQNLRSILTNKRYLGVRVYRDGASLKETKAVWPPIIDEVTFRRTQEILEKNKKRKPPTKSRYPFLLSTLVNCDQCGERLVGKSAHGNGGKIPYYEHGTSLKREGCLKNKSKKCAPFRVQAKILEPQIWEIVQKLVLQPMTAKKILNQASALSQAQDQSSELSAIEKRMASIQNKIQALTDRLSELPQSVSAEPIYRQMEKLEREKEAEANQLQSLRSSFKPKVVSLGTYRTLRASLRRLSSDAKGAEVRHKIIQTLIHQIRITQDGFKVEYYCGEEDLREISKFSASAGSTRLTSGGPNGNDPKCP